VGEDEIAGEDREDRGQLRQWTSLLTLADKLL
jgi:hypothetical protein